MTVKESAIGALESFVNIVNYYRTTGEAVMEKKCTNGALGRGCAGTVEYYRSTGEALLAYM